MLFWCVQRNHDWNLTGIHVSFSYNEMAAKIPQAAMTLKQFMLRQQVLKLYRSLLRAIREISDEESKREALQWVRTDFRNNRHHIDEYVIKMLIYHGECQLKQLQQNIAFSR